MKLNEIFLNMKFIIIIDISHYEIKLNYISQHVIIRILMIYFTMKLN